MVLPTAIAEHKKVYNSGFWFRGGETQRFQKLGLTESEKKFFSVSDEHKQKVFEIKGYRCAVLICMEAQQPAYTHFAPESVDLILWPGYWGWTQDDSWSAGSRDERPNLVYQNVNSWKRPMIQSNFAFNDLGDDRNTGPEGLSVVTDANNTLRYRGEHRGETGFIVSLDQGGIRDCIPL